MIVTALAGLYLVGAPALAADSNTADDSVDVEIFRPFSDAYGYLHTPSAATLGHLQVGAQLWLNYENDPLVLVYDGVRVPVESAGASGDAGDGVIDTRASGDFQIGMGYTQYVSLTFDLPFVMFQDGYNLDNLDNPLHASTQLASSGLGDLKIIPKVVLLDRDRHPMGVAAMMAVGVPTGSGLNFMGDDVASFSPGLVAEISDASITRRTYSYRASLYQGARIRSAGRLADVRLGNAYSFGVGLGYHPVEKAEFMVDIHGDIGGPMSAQRAGEALAGVKLIFGRFVNVNLGGGAGILPGVGSPDYRVVAGLSVAPSFDPNARDTDGDTIPDGKDRCLNEKEDFDQFQDEDGCPDEDNDVDGIPDARDECPNDPEDDDGWMDNDGCPDSDNDKDGITDVNDRCPNEAETFNERDDEDGCPDEGLVGDTDGDGYDDDIDRCPYDAEDLDQFQDEDGCPEPDNDNDGITDANDECPNVREVYNGVEDSDGCPDEGRVVLEAGSIKILDRIYFDTGKTTIKPVSYSLLDEIAAVIKNHPELKKIRVEGHTDDQGSDISNLKLSQGRADSVEAALIQRGVEAQRLDAVGFGEMRPIDTNATEDGRQNNRRVEFIIIDRAI